MNLNIGNIWRQLMSTFEKHVEGLSDKQLVALFNELNIQGLITEQQAYRFEVYSKEIETRFDTRFKQLVKFPSDNQYNGLDLIWEAAYVDKDHLWELFLEAMTESNTTIKSIVNTPEVDNSKDDAEYCTSCASKLVWQSCMLICSGCKKHYAG